jgi:peptidoglycan lytic transglycosylase G
MRRVAIFLLVLLTFLTLAAGYLYLALYRPYRGFASEGVYVDIPRGASQRTIARLLAENGVVRSRLVFELLCRQRDRTLQAGEYFFDHPVTSFDVYDAIANGRVYVKEFVIPEGFTMFDIADLAVQEGFLTRAEFLAAARDPSLIRDVAPDAPTLEGFLFPATYEFPRHMAGKDMTAAMVKKFRQEWLTLSITDTPPHRNLRETVTLASLVERETPRPEERPHVAGVFENRLRIGQPLQCDPTVAYALALAGVYNSKLDGRLLHFPSPYNTYQNKGLPPGPIANPGEAALRAALDPLATDDFYFVANTEGGHFFSKTLQEHNHNVALYRRLLEGAQEPSAESAPAPQPAREAGPASAPPGPAKSKARTTKRGCHDTSGSPHKKGNDPRHRAGACGSAVHSRRG